MEHKSHKARVRGPDPPICPAEGDLHADDTHADLIAAFARAGKAIFCEKPIDLGLARVKSCLAVVRGTNAVLMVGFNRRLDPHFAVVGPRLPRAPSARSKWR